MEKVLLVGVGRMGLEYARVLKSTGKEIIAAGRGQASADNFRQNIGIEVVTGGIANYDFPESEMPDYAIIAVNVVDLYETCLGLLKRGIKKILIEKPAALFHGQINELSEMSSSIGSEIYVAYNRRFCESVLEAGRIIESDGGLLSMNFEFTEWSDKVEVFDTDQLEKERWFLSNSSHVADLAFFLGGVPQKIETFTKGSLKWHSAASLFSGSGITEKGVLFSYSANWNSPGRWGVEFMSENFRIILRPLEELHIQKRNSVKIEKVELKNDLDLKFKPGLYKMVESFLSGDNSRLCSISDQARIAPVYCQIANYI